MLGSPTRTFISMDATQRRDRLVGLLSAYEEFEVVGAEVPDHRALRAIVSGQPDVLIAVARLEALVKAAWLTRRVQEALPQCAIVAAADDAPGAQPPGQLAADRRLPQDAPLTDLIEAALHAARAQSGAPGRDAPARRRAAGRPPSGPAPVRR